MGDENPICTLGDYLKPSHEGYSNTIELLVGNNLMFIGIVHQCLKRTICAQRRITILKIHRLQPKCRMPLEMHSRMSLHSNYESKFQQYQQRIIPPAVPERTTVETVLNMSPENKAHFESEKEAIHLILTGIGDEIYSTVDARKTAHEI
ncbi:hypothetical protein Tco_0854993 [Tanacetum coccineum]